MTLSGLLNIHKEPGITSFRATSLVKKTLGVKKAGHCGTLDPAAEGVLLVLFGAATKLQDGLMSLPKTYRARVLLGRTTDTGDAQGKTKTISDVPGGLPGRMETVLSKFRGEIEQVPPMYSALKYGGRKLYELARQGLEVERAKRKVTIYSLDLLSIEGPVIELRAKCSRGTYIRTLAEDIGAELGCGGMLEYLCRESVGPFTVEAAIRIPGNPPPNSEQLLRAALNEEQIHNEISRSRGDI
jgi:tRNA pseudouridine55 synthase